jgi:hypothetical protein
MVGFSIISFQKNNGIICRYSEFQPYISYFVFDKNTIKSQLEKLKKEYGEFVVSDVRQVYRVLSFLDPEYLLSLKFFDCRSFFNVYKNAQNIDVPGLAQKNFNLTLADDKNKLQKIWEIQGESNWNLIPYPLIEVYLEKDALAAFKIASNLKKVKLSLETSVYYDFFQEFLLYLTLLEETGIYSKGNKVVPRYEYDKTITGRLINTYPYCYQVLSQHKFAEACDSRFGKDGILLIADWKNAEFRVAAALSKEKIEGEKKDPYTLIGKAILGKSQITPEERQDWKERILAVMYGNSYQFSNEFFSVYPNIATHKKEIVAEARKNLKLTTKFGKTRFFGATEKFETKAFNTINQMTVADLSKKAIIETQKEFKEKGLKSVMLPYVVYDNFLFDVHKDELEAAKAAIQAGLIERTIPHSFKQYVEFEVDIEELK